MNRQVMLEELHQAGEKKWGSPAGAMCRAKKVA